MTQLLLLLSLALFSLLPFSTHPLAYTDSTGNIAFYSASACQSPLFINNFTLGPDVCGDPFSIDDPLTTTIESYIINERPTCSDGHIPTFYTYQDAACYQGVAERSEIGLESDTSCVTSVQFVAMAFICNGFGDLDGNRWDNTGGNDNCGGDGGNEEGNDEGGNYNGCALGVGTGGDGIDTSGTTGDRCDGISNGGCVATSCLGRVPLATASASTTPSLPTIPTAATAPSYQLPVPMDSANTTPSTMAQSPSTAATRRSPTTAIPQTTAPATSAATLLTIASARSTSSESSTGVEALYCGLISTLAAALMLSMSL